MLWNAMFLKKKKSRNYLFTMALCKHKTNYLG